MRNWKIAALAGTSALMALALSGCGTVDESVLNTEANYTVSINVPYATATPLPDYLNVPDAIVIDSDGNVTLNDPSVIEGSFQSARDREEQTEYRSLSLGSTGIAVQALQSRLKDLGYFEGDISGLFDSETEAAVKRFEQTYGTMQTGVATAKLQLRLFASTAPAYGSDAYNEAVVSQYTVLRPGTVGSSVYALQQRLKNLDYPITDLTGVFDAQTAACVRLFYQSYGIAASDVADVNMQRELYADTAHYYDTSLRAVATMQPSQLQSQLDAITLPGEVDGDGAEDIAPGNSGDRVTLIQRRLIELGYMAQGGDTGEFDQATQNAVNRFLQAVGRAPSGALSAEMQAFLLSNNAPVFGGVSNDTQFSNLNPGDAGEAVLKLQRRLVELGYANGTPNGQYGNATISAVQLYQQANGLDMDGLASAWLQVMMFSDDALTYAEAMGIDPEALETVTESAAEPADAGDTLYFNLGPGSTGNAVMALQNRLNELGYACTPTRTYDEETEQAVMAFQRAIGVTETGEASASLQRYITSFAAPGPNVRFYDATQTFTQLSPGDSGEMVERLQRQLYELGYIKRADIEGSVGGYNEGTRLAVVSAQLAMGYESADGVAGVEFQSFIFSKYAGRIRR